MIVHDDSFFYRVLAYGNLGFGEAWMDGHIEMSQGPLHDLLTVLAAAQPSRFVKNHARLLLTMFKLRIASVFRTQAKNVRHHYDIGNELFMSFLDETMTHSCGYAENHEHSLDIL